MDLLTIGLDFPPCAPTGVRLHAVGLGEVDEMLARYGPAFDGVLIAAGLPGAEAAVAALLPGVPVAVVAAGGLGGGSGNADRAVVEMLTRTGAVGPGPLVGGGGVADGTAWMPSERSVRSVSAWPLAALGRVGGPVGQALARSWRATLADVVGRQTEGCGVAVRYVVRGGTLGVGVVVWGEGVEPSEAVGRREALERALAPLLAPTRSDAERPYVFGRPSGERSALLLGAGGVDRAVRLRAPSAGEIIGQLGPVPWEPSVVLEGAEGLDQPTAAATAAVGPLVRVMRDAGVGGCIEVAVTPAPLSAAEREAALAFVRAVRDEGSAAVRRAVARAAQLAVEGTRTLRVRVTAAGEGSVPEALLVEAARACVGDPATVDALAVEVERGGGAVWFGNADGGGPLVERAPPDEAGRRFALPVPEGRGLWGMPVAPPPLPAALPTHGVRIGTVVDSSAGGALVRLPDDALRRHLYVVGASGTGKSQFLVHLASRRAAEGRAVLVIDPHGDTTSRVARSVHAAGREVVEVDLGDPESPWRLNPIEVDPAVPNARSVLAEALLDLFGQLWDMQEAGGPMFETYFRNALYLTMSKGSEPGTLRDVWRVFSDESFRTELLLGCEDREVVRFWTRTAGRAGGEASLENIAPYVLSKLSPLVSNDALAHLVAAPRSTLDVGELLEGGSCVVVRLDKGRLGSYGSRLAGTVLLSRVLLAAMRRPSDADDALVVVDEFQNFVTPQMGELLAEARKFRVQFALAHQTLAQVPERLLQTVLGNAGNICVFRPGVHDATRLAPYLAPEYNVERLLALPNFRAASRVLVAGAPSAAFELRSDPPE